MKELIVAEITRRIEAQLDIPPQRACLYWAHHTVEVCAEFGFRALIQSGSLNVRRLAHDLDDGRPGTPTHYSYEFHAREFKGHIAAGRFPEIHCWCALPDYPSRENPTIIDMTTKYLVQNAAESGLEWLHTFPPEYLWEPASEIDPDDYCYTADILATMYALACIKEIKSRKRQKFACQSARVM